MQIVGDKGTLITKNVNVILKDRKGQVNFIDKFICKECDTLRLNL